MTPARRAAATCAVLLAGLCSSAPAHAAGAGVLAAARRRLRLRRVRRRAGAAVERAGGRVLRRLGAVRGAVVEGAPGLAADVLRRRLLDARVARYVEPDFLVSCSPSRRTIRSYASQYALDQPSARDVSAPQAWSTGRTACSKVAVLDSGVDNDHPDLKPNLWKNSGEKSGNGKDDDKNGYVDDYYGVDLVDGKGSGIDENGHGTHVAGEHRARSATTTSGCRASAGRRRSCR